MNILCKLGSHDWYVWSEEKEWDKITFKCLFRDYCKRCHKKGKKYPCTHEAIIKHNYES